MPTPYGSRGGLAFGAEELCVLRRALALALQPRTASAEDVQDCLRLAESVDEAVREGARLRAFLLADLARYRAALPGSLSGYLALLEDALRAGYRPVPDDLAALRALRGAPAAAALLDRCGTLAAREAHPTPAGPRRAVIPASRARLTALPGGLAATEETDEKPGRKPAEKPARKPEKPAPAGEPGTPRPARPIPTPGEVFPPKRKPGPPHAQRELAVG
ncbi:hypothetical protein AB0C59_09555 [Streptomyces sp. NPDC048664]|uniref:hypothetical protein n=1 Tax=Streptomyces sp. NPDC048664 TaxID=3154505 RepID=UPI003418D7D0